MRKNQEGYVLVYVAVVVAVLTVLGVAVCSAAVQNLQAQQAAAEALQSRLEAEGAVERAVALLRGEEFSVEVTTPAGLIDPTTGEYPENPPTAVEIEQVATDIDDDKYQTIADNAAYSDENLTVTYTAGTPGDFTVVYSIGYGGGEAEADVKVTYGYTKTAHTPPNTGDTNPTHKYTYTITVKTVEYTAYRVA